VSHDLPPYVVLISLRHAIPTPLQAYKTHDDDKLFSKCLRKYYTLKHFKYFSKDFQKSVKRFSMYYMRNTAKYVSV